MDIARWREIYKVIEQKVREDMKRRNGESRKDFLFYKRHESQIQTPLARGKHLIYRQ